MAHDAERLSGKRAWPQSHSVAFGVQAGCRGPVQTFPVPWALFVQAHLGIHADPASGKRGGFAIMVEGACHTTLAFVTWLPPEGFPKTKTQYLVSSHLDIQVVFIVCSCVSLLAFIFM